MTSLRPLVLGLCLLTVAPLASHASDAIAAQLQPFVKDQVLAGAVTLVASKDKILDTTSVGFEDVAKQKPMAGDSLFWIASMSKPVTAAALMILVDEGKVKLDDPVEKYLPEFKNQMVITEQSPEQIVLRKPKLPVTVRRVLSHMSGLAFKSPVEAPTLDLLPLSNRVLSYASQPLLHEPGSKYLYSNEGINTAGRIIEVVSGMKYADFLDHRLFQPLGMKETSFWLTPAQIERLAKAYRGNKEKTALEETPIGQLTYPLDNRQVREPMPGGGLFSTAADCARFGQMLLRKGEFEGKRILSEAAVAEMSTRQTPAEMKESYGLGCSVGPNEFGHGGALSTNLTIDTARGLVFVFMVQNAGWRTDDGKKIHPAFKKAALDEFAK